MLQILQNFKDGKIDITDVPVPQCKKGTVTVQSTASLISSGTERMLLEFGRSGMIAKAKSQPEKVKQVLDKIKTDGILSTMQAVYSKLDTPIPLGYSNVGNIIEVGNGVLNFNPGDRVVSNGSHAEIVNVPVNLCAKIPDPVSDEEAAFTVLGAIALQGIRLADPKIGDHVVVVGLGVIGLLTVQMLIANGCRVLGVDFDEEKLKLASSFGAEVLQLSGEADPVKSALQLSNNNGVDAVLITASTTSSDPVRQAAQMCRKRGKIILVGVTGLELNRADFYEKELTFQVSCSYGPGRYDENYELKGQDYPYGFVRWTVRRNFEAVLDLMARGKINVKPLIGSTYPFEKAHEAYDSLLKNTSQLGIVLRYGERTGRTGKTIVNRSVSDTSKAGKVVAGVIGAGNFASHVIVPELKKRGVRLKTIASTGGTGAAIAGKKYGFEQFTSDADAICKDPEITTVFIATRHNSHARFTTMALLNGKHVFVEKPLAMNEQELHEIKKVYQAADGKQLLVGFNRRFSPYARKIRTLLSKRSSPVTAVYIVNAGALPPEHWTKDPETGGGRIIGESCHFIDLLHFVTNSQITSVHALAIGGNESLQVREDKVTISMSFADGSTGTVHYFANGSKRYPKEKLTIFSDERVLEMENFKSMHGYGFKNFSRYKTWKQEKGHTEELQEFIKRLESGGPPLIAWESMEMVTRATFDAVDALKNI